MRFRMLVAITFLVGACGGGGSGAKTEPEKSACAQAFDSAAAVDPMQDTVSDLYPAVRACSLTEWRTEFAAHNGAGFSGSADSVLGNVCFASEVASTALCKEVQ